MGGDARPPREGGGLSVVGGRGRGQGGESRLTAGLMSKKSKKKKHAKDGGGEGDAGRGDGGSKARGCENQLWKRSVGKTKRKEGMTGASKNERKKPAQMGAFYCAN